MEILIKALQLIASLSILVIFHELGHFIPAKLFKIRVEKFYLFFDPWFSLFKIKRKDTEYGVGWLPLGGYVKISGMIDESMDKEQMKQPPQPHEFRSKPAWQRLIVMIGGVTVNIVLAILIYILMLTFWGEEYLPTKNLKYGITCDSLALKMGLMNGDKILTVNNKYIEDYSKIPAEIILENAKTIQIQRDSQKLEINIPKDLVRNLVKHKSPDFLGIRFPFEIEAVSPGSVAEKAGLLAKDKFLMVDSIETIYFDQFRSQIIKNKEKEVKITVLRNSKDTVVKTLTVPKEGVIGVQARMFTNFIELKQKDYSFFEAIPAGTIKAFVTVGNYIKQFKLIFSKDVKAYESVGGFITIGNLFPPYWDWQVFWGFTAFLSIILAFMNILPIPALDGGHVLFLLYEIITRRKPSDKFLEYAQIVGMVILFSLLLYANANDVIKLFR